MKHFTLLIIFFSFSIVMLSGCAPKVVPDRVRERTVYLDANPAELLEALNQRNNKITGLRGKGRLEYRFTFANRDFRGTDLTFSFHKPGKVYARGNAGMAGEVFMLKSDGKRFWAENKKKRTVITALVGRTFKLSQEPELWEGMSPNVLSEALLLDDLSGLKMVSVTLPEYYIIDLLEESEGSLIKRRRIWIDRKQLIVQRHQVFNKDGKLETEAFLYKYKEIDGILIPTLYRIERRWEELSLLMELSDIRLNPEYNQKLYTYTVPAGYQVKDLDGREDAESGKS